MQEGETGESQISPASRRVRDALGEGWDTLEVLVTDPWRVADELKSVQKRPPEPAAALAEPAPSTPGAQHVGIAGPTTIVGMSPV